jgi:DDE superfamily endonuclease
MVRDFDRQTHDKANGNVRVLLLDGHSSHYSLDLLKYARAQNIVILGYPLHCTHVLQGLDVVCFAKMKEAWKNEIRAFESLHMQPMKKSDFTGVFGNAFLKAFTKPIIESAFAATGIHPFNRDIITLQQTRTSKALSTVAGFGVLQLSPVHAILSVWSRAQTSSPDHTLAVPTDPSLLPSMPVLDSPDTTLHQIQFGVAALRTTESGSILVLQDQWTSANQVPPLILNSGHQPPEPDWSLLEDCDVSGWTREELKDNIDQFIAALQSAKENIAFQEDRARERNAQLLIQNLVLQKMNQKIHAEENKRKNDQTKLFPGGKGRHLTGNDFVDELEQAVEARAQKKVVKDSRAERWRRTTDFNDQAKRAWENYQGEYERTVEEWKAQCNELLSQGTLKRNLLEVQTGTCTCVRFLLTVLGSSEFAEMRETFASPQPLGIGGFICLFLGFASAFLYCTVS